MKVSPYTTNSTTLFIGTDGGDIYKVTNANSNIPLWTDLTPPAYEASFIGSISSIEFGASENQIMLTFHNYGVINIYYTEDGGATWQNKEGDLPDLPVKDIMMNPLLNSEVIIATDLGVWKTNNFAAASPHWTHSYNGMEDVKVTSFDLRTADNTVLAATYGRGFFTGQFTATASIDEVSQNSIMIYPTVSDGAINIKSNTYTSNATMQVYDMLGKLVYNSKIDLAHEVSKTLHVNAGTYLVKLTGDGLSETHKIIIK